MSVDQCANKMAAAYETAAATGYKDDYSSLSRRAMSTPPCISSTVTLHAGYGMCCKECNSPAAVRRLRLIW